MFPIHILKPKVELPPSGTYYVVAKNGIFLHKETGLIRAIVKIDGISFLEEAEPSAQLVLPKLSQDLIVRSLLFFRAVYRKLKSEAEVQLHYNSSTEDYLLYCPKQLVSAAGVSYDSRARFDGYQLIGTIHSHCGFGAFHSSIDHGDEKYFDGLHITIGHVDQPYFSISCSIMVNGHRFTLNPEEVIIGIKQVDWQPKTRAIYRRKLVSHCSDDSGGLISRFLGISFSDRLDWEPVVGSSSKNQFWDIAMPEGQDYRHVGFPRNWLNDVESSIHSLAKAEGDKAIPAPPMKRSGLATSRRHFSPSSFEEGDDDLEGNAPSLFWRQKGDGLGI